MEESEASKRNRILIIIAVAITILIAFSAITTALMVLSAQKVGTFTLVEGEIETVDGKPVIRMYSTTWCPHCNWVGPAFEEVAKEYEGRVIAKHWQVDIGDDALTPEFEGGIPTKELAVFHNLNPSGSVPYFVFGNYIRSGTAFELQDNLEAEKEEFRLVIETLLEEVE